jgi:hypothetical protein
LRQHSPQRRVSSLVERKSPQQEHKRKLTPSVSPEETVTWKEHEYAVLYGLWSHPQERCRYWELLNTLAKKAGSTLRVNRPEKRRYMAVVQRLKKEGSVYRIYRPNEIILTPHGSDRLREIVGLRREPVYVNVPDRNKFRLVNVQAG